jgi:hypothetical protein
MVHDTIQAGAAVHEFNPDASPEQKAAEVKKVTGPGHSPPLDVILILIAGHASGPRFEEYCQGHRFNNRYGIPQSLSSV